MTPENEDMLRVVISAGDLCRIYESRVRVNPELESRLDEAMQCFRRSFDNPETVEASRRAFRALAHNAQ